MGAISRLLEDKLSKRTNFNNPASWLFDWAMGGEDSATGLRVSENKALKYTPFWAAVRIISGTLAALPFLVYKRKQNGDKKRNFNHPTYKLIHERPNEYMDSLTFIETRQAHVLCYGNGYAEIQRDGGGRPVALWPLLPDRTARKVKDGIFFYEIRSQAGNTDYLPDRNVLHIKGLGFDGYTGYNVVKYHKQAIAYGMAVKEYGSRFFGNDASPGGTLETPDSLSDKAFKHLKESWNDRQRGLSQAHRMQILEEGLKFNKIGVDPAQAQALEVQKWTVDDCSRIFQIPPHKLGSMEFSKYNNVEQLQLDFVATTMLYWFRKWELECNYKLFMPSERGKLFCEINVDGLLRSDLKTRYMAYNIGRNAGFLCVDDIRDKENMNHLPEGKGQVFLQPLNMLPIEAGKDTPVNPVQAAHKKLLASQISRLIKYQMKSKRNNGDSFESQKKYAKTILMEPVIAYASLTNRQQLAEYAIEKRICRRIGSETELNMKDADILADELMREIGGRND